MTAIMRMLTCRISSIPPLSSSKSRSSGARVVSVLPSVFLNLKTFMRIEKGKGGMMGGCSLRFNIRKGFCHEQSDKEWHNGQDINNVHTVLDNDNNDQDKIIQDSWRKKRTRILMTQSLRSSLNFPNSEFNFFKMSALFYVSIVFNLIQFGCPWPFVLPFNPFTIVRIFQTTVLPRNPARNVKLYSGLCVGENCLKLYSGSEDIFHLSCVL